MIRCGGITHPIHALLVGEPNQTYRQEIQGGYLWSPKRNANQARNLFYESMREVSPGDIVFSFVDARIAAIGVARSYCGESPKPQEFGSAGQNWENVGWKVRVHFIPLTNRIRPKDHMDALRPVLPSRYGPLQWNGNGIQSVYLTEVPSVFAEVLKAFNGTRVCEIDNDAIREYQKKRCKIVSDRTVNLECKLLRVVMKAAKVWGHVADEYKPLREEKRGPGRALEPEQEKLLFDTAREKPGWDAAFYAALVANNTTMRGHELKRLRLENVDLVDRRVVVGKSKTDAGQRVIPLNATAIWSFARLLERAHALGCKEPEHFVFPAFRYRKTKSPDRGTGYEPTKPQKTWRTAWRSLVKEAARRAGRSAAQETLNSGKAIREAITAWKRAATPLRKLRFHDLRHCAITKLAESQASAQTIMSIAGHLDRKMLEHYSHIRNAAKRRAVESISSYNPEEAEIAPPDRVVPLQ